MKKKLMLLLLVTASLIGITVTTAHAEATKGELRIYASDADSENSIKNMAFTIYDEKGEEVKTIITKNNGIAKTANLPLGNYTVKQSLVPKGYKKDETPISFTLTKDCSFVKFNSVNKKTTSSQTDAANGELRISVTDDATEKGIEGVYFSIYDTKGKEVLSIKSNKNGIAKTKKIPFGNYTIKQTKTPDGYEANETPINFSSTSNWNFVKYNYENKKVDKNVERRKFPIRANLDDYFSITNVDIEKATFRLRDSTGKEFDFNFDHYGVTTIDGVALGDATIVQIGDIDSIKSYPETKITIEQNDFRKDFAKTQDITIEPYEVTTKITVLDEESNEPISGITYNSTDNSVRSSQRQSETDENGSIEIKSLKNTSYSFTEIKVPKEYQFDPDTRHSIDTKKIPNILLRKKRQIIRHQLLNLHLNLMISVKPLLSFV